EPIDDVRFLGNRSSGKMGFAIAELAARRGAEVTLIAGPVALPIPPGNGITRQDVETAAQMGAALHVAASSADVVVMAAAVADFRPAIRAAGKLSRRDSSAGAGGTTDTLALLANPDLLAEMGRASRNGRPGSPRPFLVGFAAEVAADGPELVKRALRKLQEKNCDVIVANDVGASGVGFGSDDNAITIVYGDGTTESLPRAPKREIAAALWDRLARRLPPAIGGIPVPPHGPGPGAVRAVDMGSGAGGRRG
ncbi:MAG: phosphopantothenoylcysteine decarboxylase, partial [Myxococcales bacterium]